MTTKTLQFLGTGYGETPITVTATLGGQEIFNGTVPTINGPVNTSTPVASELIMFSGDVDYATIGAVPMTITVGGTGTLVLTRIKMNYLFETNTIYSEEDYATLMDTTQPFSVSAEVFSRYATPALTTEEVALISSNSPADKAARRALLSSRGLAPMLRTGAEEFHPLNWELDPRVNVVINGTAVTSSDSRAITTPGEVITSWAIPSGSTISYDVYIPVGTVP